MNKGIKALLMAAGAGAVIFAGWKILAKSKGGAAPLKPVDGCRTVVLLGDSTIGGPTLRYYLESSLEGCSTVEQQSYQGQRTDVILGKAGAAVSENPTDLVVLAGVNDIWQGKSAASVIKNLEAIYAIGRAAHVRVIAVQILPWAKYHGGISEKQAAATQEVNDHIAMFSTADNVVETEAMGDGEGGLHPAFDNGSHLHLNPTGMEALADLIKTAAF